jgi:hypothetical protein
LLTIPSSGPAASSRCAARASTTLLQNSQVRVFKQRSRDGVRKFEVFACLKATGQGTPLGSAADATYPFLPPAIDLTGPVVGYGIQLCDVDFCATGLYATDMRHPNDVRGSLNGSYGAPGRHRLVKVGSLRVARSGVLVWIACPEAARRKVRGERGPNCIRPGDRDSVYLRPLAGKPFKLLDRGRTIDPSSLRLKAGRISWLHGHHRRHASIP